MTALDNAVAAIQTAATAVETAVSDLVAALAADNPTDVAAAVTTLQGIATALSTSAASDPGPQPAAPSSTFAQAAALLTGPTIREGSAFPGHTTPYVPPSAPPVPPTPFTPNEAAARRSAGLPID